MNEIILKVRNFFLVSHDSEEEKARDIENYKKMRFGTRVKIIKPGFYKGAEGTVVEKMWRPGYRGVVIDNKWFAPWCPGDFYVMLDIKDQKEIFNTREFQKLEEKEK